MLRHRCCVEASWLLSNATIGFFLRMDPWLKCVYNSSNSNLSFDQTKQDFTSPFVCIGVRPAILSKAIACSTYVRIHNTYNCYHLDHMQQTVGFTLYKPVISSSSIIAWWNIDRLRNSHDFKTSQLFSSFSHLPKK